MMNATMWLEILVAVGCGALLGAVYFVGLWITVRRLPTSRHPALLMMVSFLSRMGIVVVGLFSITGAQWDLLLACMAGLLVARMWVVKRFGQIDDTKAAPTSQPDDPKPTASELGGPI